MRGLERSQPARARLYMLARLHRAELYRLSHASIRREFTLKKQLTLHSLRLQPKRRFRRSPVRTTQDERKRSTFRRRESRQRTLGGGGLCLANQTSSASAGIVATVVSRKNDTQPSLSASIPPEDATSVRPIAATEESSAY